MTGLSQVLIFPFQITQLVVEKNDPSKAIDPLNVTAMNLCYLDTLELVTKSKVREFFFYER